MLPICLPTYETARFCIAFLSTAHHHNHDEHAGHDAARLDDYSRLSFPQAGHDAARLDESRLSFPRAIM